MVFQNLSQHQDAKEISDMSKRESLRLSINNVPVCVENHDNDFSQSRFIIGSSVGFFFWFINIGEILLIDIICSVGQIKMSNQILWNKLCFCIILKIKLYIDNAYLCVELLEYMGFWD